MDDVPTRVSTDRPRAAAVGAILVLCLVGSPIMALLPIGMWDTARALTLSGAGLGALLLAPVAVGVMLLMWSLSRHWLMGAGASHPNSTAALVVGTGMAVPMVLSFLPPVFEPLPGGTTLLSVVATAVVTTVAMGACVLTHRALKYRRPGVLPGLAVVIAALVALPLVADHLRERRSDERSLSQVEEFEYPIVVLDHEGWAPVGVHEVREGLRLTYAHTATEGVYVVSWSEERGEEGVFAECDLTGVNCLEDGSLVSVYRGAAVEIRVVLSDETIASVRPVGSIGADDLRVLAHSLRLEEPHERYDLAQAIVGG